MNTENQTVDKVEDTQNNDSQEQTVDLSQMTRDEVEAFALKNAKAYEDQRKYNEKLKGKIKPTDDPEETPAKESTSKAEVIDPVKAPDSTASLDEQYMIASLSNKFSLEEIREAKTFIGTSFGTTLSDVTANPGFLAHINTKRELTKSDSMMNDETLHIETFQSKESFVRDVEAGNIDITADKEAREKYIQIKAKEEADKNFTR